MANKYIKSGDAFKSGNSDKGHVFGTFPEGGVWYDPTEFERIRDDGTTIIDLVPDCRVFIFGGEVTKDVVNVEISNALGGNTCTIKLANPRGKYEISKSDLVGKWREDKDILSTYDYEWLKRVTPDTPDLLSLFVSSQTSEKAKQIISALTSDPQISRLANKVGYPAIRNITRMVYEVKFFSGIPKKVGDFIFDYRDPVMVFMKGRFSPYWYFAFTGVIASWDESDTYDQEQSISMKCEDPLYFLKRARFTKQGSLLNAGNIESMTRNVNKSQAMNLWENYFGGTIDGEAITLPKALRALLFGTDNGLKVKNSHPMFFGQDEMNVDFLDAKYFSRDTLAAHYFIGSPGEGDYVKWQDESDFMITFVETKTNKDSVLTTTPNSKRWTNLIKIDQLKEIQGGSLNKYNKLSPFLPLYTQFNAIPLQEFTGAKLTEYYNASVRYWEVKPAILNGILDKEKTGWDDGEAIGVAGIHPALPYDFVSQFEILTHTWKECHSKYAKNKLVFDNLVISPHEKIRELIAGSPTESIKDSQMNLFRPRIFVILPQKFLDKNRGIMASAFGNLQLSKPENTKVFDGLREICEAVEYSVYCSPMGDIFIEPEMYDFHPTEFVLKKSESTGTGVLNQLGSNYVGEGQIEPRNISLKKDGIELQTMASEGYGEAKQNRKDFAYFYDTTANHPFFLMEKDRIRCTKTFKPENIVTHVTVMGSPTGRGGLLDAILLQTDLKQMFGILDVGAGPTAATTLGEKYYIADGFNAEIRRNAFLLGNATGLTLAIAKAKNDFENALYHKLMETEYNSNILTLLFKAGTAMVSLLDANFDLQGNVLDPSLNYLFTQLRAMKDLNGLDENVNLLSESDPYVVDSATGVTAEVLAPTLMTYMQKIIDSQERKTFKLLSDPLWDTLITVSPRSYVKEFVIPKEDAANATIYGLDIANADVVLTDLSRTQIDIKKDLIKLYLPIAIDTDSALRIQYLDIQQLEQIKGDKTTASDIMTLGDLKVLEQLGLYNPSKDMTRYYGYNPGPTIQNLMIKNDAEAVRYARTWFNKLFGRSQQIHMEIIGRPELMLNRPYYCERKDSIGLLINYSLQYSVESDFQTSLDLIYIRPNALTYAYTNTNLDELTGTHTNTYFKNAAIDYYNSLADRVNLVQKGMSAIGKRAGKKIGGETGSQIGQQLLDYKGKGYAGALYTAHNWIGHMEFDRTGREGETVTGAATDRDLTDPKNQLFIAADSKILTEPFLRYTTAITAYLKELVSLENKIIAIGKDIAQDVIQIGTNQNELDFSIYSYKATGVTTSKQAELTKKALANVATAELWKKKHAYLCNHIYGFGEFKGSSGSEERIPSVSDLKSVYRTFYTKDKYTTYVSGTAENVSINKNSLYHQLLNNVIEALKIPFEKIQLLDDRTVGSDTLDKQYVLKYGNTSIPMYVAPITGSWADILTTTTTTNE